MEEAHRVSPGLLVTPIETCTRFAKKLALTLSSSGRNCLLLSSGQPEPIQTRMIRPGISICSLANLVRALIDVTNRWLRQFSCLLESTPDTVPGIHPVRSVLSLGLTSLAQAMGWSPEERSASSSKSAPRSRVSVPDVISASDKTAIEVGYARDTELWRRKLSIPLRSLARSRDELFTASSSSITCGGTGAASPFTGRKDAMDRGCRSCISIKSPAVSPVIGLPVASVTSTFRTIRCSAWNRASLSSCVRGINFGV